MITNPKEAPQSALEFGDELRMISLLTDDLRGRVTMLIAERQREIDLLQDLLGRVPADPSEEPEEAVDGFLPRESHA